MPYGQRDDDTPQKIDRLQHAMYSRTIAPTLHEKERHTLERDPDMVPHDWEREEPRMSAIMTAPPAARAASRAKPFIIGFFVLSLIFFLAAVGYFLYFFFIGSNAGGISTRNIDIAITGPQQVMSGTKSEFQIAITNHNSQPLEAAQLIVTYPTGARSPADFATLVPQWVNSLGTIAPGETRRGVTYIVLNGTQGGHATIKVEVQYRIPSSNSVFLATNEYSFVFGSTPVSVTVDGTNQTVSKQSITLTATIASNTTAPVKNVLVRLQSPFGFKLTESHPAIGQDNVWNIGDLNPGESKKVQITGVVSGAAGDSRVFTFGVGGYASATSTTLDTVFTSVPFAVSIGNPFLDVAITIKDSPEKTVVLQPGQKTTVTLSYTNMLSTPLTDATLIVHFNGYQLNGTYITTPDGFYRSNDQTIIWNKSTKPELESIPPGGTGTVTFTFSAPTTEELVGRPPASIGISVSSAGSRTADSGAIEALQGTTQRTFVVASAVQLSANALYYSSPYKSVGPMPPVVGQETTYAGVFTLVNSTNLLKNVKVTAALPVYVRTTGKISPSYEKLKVNLEKGIVTWDVGDLQPNTGAGSTQTRQVAFEIGLTPSISQLGQKPVLLKDIILTGIDTVTGQTVYLSSTSTTGLSDVLSDLKGDAVPAPLDTSVVAQ